MKYGVYSQQEAKSEIDKEQGTIKLLKKEIWELEQETQQASIYSKDELKRKAKEFKKGCKRLQHHRKRILY